MHAMVEQLRKDKQEHDEGVENLTLKQLREKVRDTTDWVLKSNLIFTFGIADPLALNSSLC